MIDKVRKTGNERFICGGKPLSQDVLSFWQWSSSDLLGNALRGILAEYIVAMAVGTIDGIREEWDAYDTLTPKGTKLEVKSAAYLQSWEQSKLSRIQFSIRPTRAWLGFNEEGLDARGEAMRQADKYVFCLLAHKERETVDPTNLDQWQFYVLETAELNEKLASQKSLSLSTLQAMSPRALFFHGTRRNVKLRAFEFDFEVSPEELKPFFKVNIEPNELLPLAELADFQLRQLAGIIQTNNRVYDDWPLYEALHKVKDTNIPFLAEDLGDGVHRYEPYALIA